jgi:hypothetical protein
VDRHERNDVIIGFLLVLVTMCCMFAATNSCYGQECPPPGSITCQLWPHLCEGCEEPGIDRMKPIDPSFYELPRVVGVAQSGDFEYLDENPQVTSHWTLNSFLDEIASHGIRAASLITKEVPWIDQSGAFGRDDFDVLIVRPSAIEWTYYEYACHDRWHSPFSEFPMDQWAEYLYATHGDRELIVILTEYELDWGLRGLRCGCDEQMSVERELYVRHWITLRQQQLNEVRSRYPDAKLRVMWGPTANKYPCNDECPDEDTVTLAEIIRDLPTESQPDLILMSYYCKNNDIAESIRWLARVTGYPRARIVVSELGVAQDRDQYRYLYDQTVSAWQAGSRVITWWIYKETWCGDPSTSLGLWYVKQPCQGRVEWTTPAPGYYALRDLMWR